jgi:hypothetical protein
MPLSDQQSTDQQFEIVFITPINLVRNIRRLIGVLILPLFL